MIYCHKGYHIFGINRLDVLKSSAFVTGFKIPGLLELHLNGIITDVHGVFILHLAEKNLNFCIMLVTGIFETDIDCVSHAAHSAYLVREFESINYSFIFDYNKIA